MSLSDRLPSALQKKRLSNRIKDHMLYNTDASISDISNILINKYKYKESDIEKIIDNQGVSLDSFINIDDIPKKQESSDFTDFIDGSTIIAKGISAEDISCNEISATNIYFSGKIYDKDGVEFTGGGTVKLTVKDKKADITAPENNQIVVQTSDNTIHRYNGSAWVGIGGTSATSSGIDIRGGSSVTDISESDISLNDSTAGFVAEQRKEGEIIYDSSQNIFFEASRSKTDIGGNGDLAFRPLGYSFFRDNMEGQPPALDPFFFFFLITPSSIQISWTNPKQYASGVSNIHDPINSNSGELASTVNANHNIYFPVVNRVMIQIYNNETGLYETWGTKRSPITSSTATSGGVTDLSSGYVICAKNYPIPPMNTSTTSFFGTRNDFGRTTKVYELNDFANSIILYKQNSTPINKTIVKQIESTLVDNTKLVSALKDEPGKELTPSSSGYKIKLWLENQYDSGSMTESDFNVTTLINDNNGVPINFLSVASPSAPTLLTPSIAFNDMGSVSSGNTVVQLIVKDPQKTTTTTSGDYNKTINFVGIKFEYANAIGEPLDADWTPINKIYYSTSLIPTNGELPSLVGVTDGIYIVDRLNDASFNDVPSITEHFFYIKLNNDFLGVTDNSMNNTFKFRASYKNASSDDFGDTLQSASILINEPTQPIISSVKMTEYNKFTITLGQFTDVEDIIGDTISDSVAISNTNMGVYLKDISFNVAYKYGDEASQNPITTFTEIQGGESSSTTTDSVLINTTSFASSTYTYEIPTGLFPSDSTNTNAITYYFSASVKNNLINKFSAESAQRSIEITKPNSSIALILTPQEAVANYNNKIQATWSLPQDGFRGIVTSQASVGLPKLDQYTLQSNTLRKVDNDVAVTHSNTTNESARNADPTRNRMFTFYDTLKSSTGTIMPINLDLTIREYNEYINNHTEVSTTISATATKPAVVIIGSHTALSISNTTTKNAVTLNWVHPTDRGLTIGVANIRNTISTYTVDISRNSTTNKYLDSNSSWQDVTFQTTTIQTDNTNDRIGTTDAVNSIILTSTQDNSLLWPDSIYNYTIRATNSLDYQSDAQTTVGTFSTGEPTFPSIFTYFDNTRLDSLRNTYDLFNNNNYTNLGVLVSGGISSTTTYAGTAVQITNTKTLVDITSGTITHVLNKKHLQDFSTPLSSTDVQSWSSAVPTTAKQAGFKIVNAADSDAVLYTRGMSTNHTTESGDYTLFDVLRTNRKDIYSETYDNRNGGYWLIEDIQYKINLTTEANLTSYLYKPLKFELESYYNTNGSDANISTTLNGKTIILQNSYSSNSGNVYLDILDSNPSIGKNAASNDMITYTPSNQINGIPNLARGGTIGLKYKLSNYSQYYLLQNDVNVSEHYFSYATGSSNSVISWGSKAGGTRHINNWVIEKTLSSIPITDTATTGITIKIRARNTKYFTDFPINSSANSTVFNFIYDKPSSDEFGIIESSLQEVPSSFNPTYGTASAQSAYLTTAYSAKNGISNNKQLSLWNNYFYGSEGWRTDTGITTANCANYGMANTLPVFNIGTDYKWVIFKYQGQGNTSSAYTYYTVIAKFSDSDFDYDKNVVDEDIVVYFYNRGLTTKGNDTYDYYWLNISGKSGYGKGDASTGAINTYAGTVGISTQSASSSNFESASYTKLGITGSRILGGWLNSSAIPQGTTADFYLAVGIKNTTATNTTGAKNKHVKIRKPEITLAQESNVRQLLS